VGDSLHTWTFRGPAVAKKLRGLLESSDVAACCHEVASRFVNVNPIDQTCDLIEGLGRKQTQNMQ
jgi:hypothetical protein